MSVEDERAYLDILKQMLSEILQARQDRSLGGDSPWGVPNLVTGMHGRGVNKESHGERMENKEERYHGEEENEGRGRSRYKRREKLYSFIKKTVVPYPRLG